MVRSMKTIHLALRTNKRQEMIAFFECVFEFKLLEEFTLNGGVETICFMSDDETAKIELICSERFTGSPSGQVLSHYGFFITNYAQVLAASIRAGLPVLDQVFTQSRKQFYIQDPDGNYVEINGI